MESHLQLDHESQPHLENHLPVCRLDKSDTLERSNSLYVLVLVFLVHVDGELHSPEGTVSPIRLLQSAVKTVCESIKDLRYEGMSQNAQRNGLTRYRYRGYRLAIGQQRKKTLITMNHTILIQKSVSVSNVMRRQEKKKNNVAAVFRESRQ